MENGVNSNLFCSHITKRIFLNLFQESLLLLNILSVFQFEFLSLQLLIVSFESGIFQYLDCSYYLNTFIVIFQPFREEYVNYLYIKINNARDFFNPKNKQPKHKTVLSEYFSTTSIFNTWKWALGAALLKPCMWAKES